MKKNETNLKTKHLLEDSDGYFACFSNVGTNRKNNEDIAYYSLSPYGALLLIADGMGGHRKGEVASKMACDTLSYIFNSNRKTITSKSAKKLLVKGFTKANNEIYKLSNTQEFNEMGTTLVAAILYSTGCYILSVGDSRLYKMKDNKLTQVSVDQTNIQFYKETGRLKNLEDEKKMRKLLLNAIGINPDLINYEEYSLSIDEYDKLFLCSDGINSVLEDSDIESILNKKATAKEKLNEIIDTALERKVLDNVACVLWER